MADVVITEFTDPGCPWAYSAEPFRRRIMWLYGDAIEWQRRMVVLAEDPQEYIDKGFTPEKLASGFAKIARDHGMPIDTSLRPRVAATAPACRAVVAARLHAPEAEVALLRAFRLRAMRGELLDEESTVRGAAAGRRPRSRRAGALERRRRRRAGDARGHGRRRASRSAPRACSTSASPTGRAGGATRARPTRSCAARRRRADRRARLSAVRRLRRRARQPRPRTASAATRRASVLEVLEWAGEPLATREVAVVWTSTTPTAREELGRVADEEHLGADGLWSAAALTRYGVDDELGDLRARAVQLDLEDPLGVRRRRRSARAGRARRCA